MFVGIKDLTGRVWNPRPKPDGYWIGSWNLDPNPSLPKSLLGQPSDRPRETLGENAFLRGRFGTMHVGPCAGLPPAHALACVGRAPSHMRHAALACAPNT